LGREPCGESKDAIAGKLAPTRFELCEKMKPVSEVNNNA
jgi:hypothetical protein